MLPSPLPPGDTCQCLQAFWCPSLGRGLLDQVPGAQGCCSTPHGAQDAPPSGPRMIQSQPPVDLRWRSPVLIARSGRELGLGLTVTTEGSRCPCRPSSKQLLGSYSHTPAPKPSPLPRPVPAPPLPVAEATPLQSLPPCRAGAWLRVWARIAAPVGGVCIRGCGSGLGSGEGRGKARQGGRGN